MKLLSFVFTSLFLLCASFVSAEIFKDGQTVCFLGDSITHGGLYHYDIHDFYVTRFPAANIKFFNAGVGGDTAYGSRCRLDEDVFAKKPNVVAIMFGMNDIGLYNYAVNPTEEQLKRQKSSIGFFETTMKELTTVITDRLHPILIFMTPSPFDDTGVNDKNNNYPGSNGGLALLGDMVRKMAKENGALLVDFHTPMTALNIREQKKNPRWTLIGPDRVHPKGPGHLMMAWLFLKAQGAPEYVSRVEIDAVQSNVVQTERADVSQLKNTANELSFRLLEKAIPMPIASDATSMLELISFVDDLNREIVQITGLTDGTYELAIDGTTIGTFSAKDFNAGINLAMNAKTPQFAQSQKVLKLSQERRTTELILRSYACVRWFLQKQNVNLNDSVAIQKYYDELKNKTGYFEAQIPQYLKEWKNHKMVQEKINALDKEIHAMAQPTSHDYKIRKITPTPSAK